MFDLEKIGGKKLNNSVAGSWNFMTDDLKKV